ncbi:hypothetical protein C2E20_8473 [Micractinium conductrix]|uniref:Uncharacterized protein n=1 Tax=Micractinium conductrix TaxID=554055 RepID=A0A2P6V1D6_9CHLO|nr:hypothetical protein C2E20_8473 [Micractinium conductrix]|eukprot:PSC67901.1 hypothetical protein C2E20_8473 [Micractinium conductrix]
MMGLRRQGDDVVVRVAPRQQQQQQREEASFASEEAEYDRPALPFQPQLTPSVSAALAAQLPLDRRLSGAEQTRQGTWTVGLYWRCQRAAASGLSRREAAVGADLRTTWVASCGTPVQKANSRNTLNVPGAGYASDEALLAQLRQLASAEQMEEFIYAVMQLAKGQAEGAQQLSALQQAQQA